MIHLVERKIGAATGIDAEVLEKAGASVLRAAFARLRANVIRHVNDVGADLAPGQRVRYQTEWHTDPEYRTFIDGAEVHVPERRLLFVRAWGRYLVPEEESEVQSW